VVSADTVDLVRFPLLFFSSAILVTDREAGIFPAVCRVHRGAATLDRACETWVPLGPHRPGSRSSPTSGPAYQKTLRPISGPNDLVGSLHDLLKTFQKIPQTT
jgi:hypothetical protein